MRPWIQLGIVGVILVASGCEKKPESTQQPVTSGRGHEHGPERGHAHQGGQHGFASAEQWAPVFEDPSRETWQKPEAVIDRVAPDPEDEIAVVGAGTGYFAVRFAERFPDAVVYANDVEPDMVRHLGERATGMELHNLRPVHGEPDDPSLPHPADVVFMCNVYHHIPNPEVFFRNLIGDMKPGARLIIVDFKPEAASDQTPGPPAAMRVTAAQVRETLERLGFGQVAVDDALLPYQYLIELELMISPPP